MYLKISESLHNAPVVIAVELLSQRRYVPNVKSKYFIIAELVHNALVVMGSTAILTKQICGNCAVITV